MPRCCPRPLRAGRLALIRVAASLIIAASAAPAISAEAPPAAALPEIPCNGGVPLAVRGGDEADRADTCAGGGAAIAFLEQHGLAPVASIGVEIVDRMPLGVIADAAGGFDPGRARALLLDYPGFARFGSWLGRPIDRAMHRAIAAHEVAHALAAQWFVMPRPGRIASEYIAYATMFATMDPALRDHILGVYRDPPWTDDAPPTEAEFAADPLRFGARSWRHWSRRADPAATLRAVLDGRLLGRAWPAPE